MKPVYIFYKESPADKNKIFTVDITEKSKVENVNFKKSQRVCSDWAIYKPRHWLIIGDSN